MHANDAREATVRALFPLVRQIARRVRRMVAGVDIDDLIGDGAIGLLRAVDNFDPARGPSLEHYASRLIAGAMLNGIRRMDPVSERARRAVRDGENERYRLAAERGYVPSLQEMDRIRPGYLRALSAAYRHTPLSLDASLPENERLVLHRHEDPAAIVAARSRRAALHALVDALPERQRRLIREHYFDERSLREVGARMGVSAQRASQLHIAAMTRLRRAVHAAPR